MVLPVSRAVSGSPPRHRCRWSGPLGTTRMPPHAVRRIPNRAAREPGSRGRPKNGFVGRPPSLAGGAGARRLRLVEQRREPGADAGDSSYAAGMDDLAGADVSPEDDEFTVAQDTEFAEDDLVLG